MVKKGIIYIDRPVDTPDNTEEEVKLNNLAQETDEPIYEIGSVFPFTLFPDKVIIYKHRVTIVRKDLFFKRVFPMLIEDIRTVRISRSIIFATMEFEVVGYEENPRPVTTLNPTDAIKAQKYVVGLIRAKRENIDLSAISNDTVRDKLEEISAEETEAAKIF